MALWTQSDVDELAVAIKAVACGAKSVSFGGPPARTVTHHNLEEMLVLLGQMQAVVNADAGTSRLKRVQTDQDL